MTSTLLALALALADPNGFPAPHALAVAPPAAAPAAHAAPSQPAPATAAPSSAAPLTLPASGSLLDGLILPVAALLALAVAALLATRRRQQASRLVRVLETTGIGPKRALVVAQIGDEIMVIGSSEAGLQLLAARPAGLEPRAAEAPSRLQAVPDPGPAAAPARGVVLGLLSRLRGGRRADPAPASPGFDALLSESTEDLELRRKLALGQSGSVR